MSAEEVARLRNVAIVGQGGTGKTSVADALLFAAGAATRIGRVDDGSSAFDIEAEEQRRKSTITASLHHVTWKKHEVNVIDTPGYSAFLHDTRNCLAAATGVVLVLGPTGGEVKVETEKGWAWCLERGLPAVGFPTGKAFGYQGASGTMKEEAAPADLADEVVAARERLVETIAEANDELLEKYLEGVELSADELSAAPRGGKGGGKVLPGAGGG